MNKVDEFTEASVTTSSTQFTKVKAVSVTGLQQCPDWSEGQDRTKNVWVLNEAVQIDCDGHTMLPWINTLLLAGYNMQEKNRAF